jgi:hypothetical protein
MRVVQEAERLPRKCLVTGRPQGPFVDFQVDVQPPSPNQPHNLYIHALIVEEAAKALGMVPGAEVERLLEQLHALKGELDEAREDMRVYAEFEERFKSKESA